jgi:hypothetical protein
MLILIQLTVAQQATDTLVNYISRTVAVNSMNETFLSSLGHVINSGTIQERSEVG